MIATPPAQRQPIRTFVGIKHVDADGDEYAAVLTRVQLAMVAANEAWADSGLADSGAQAREIRFLHLLEIEQHVVRAGRHAQQLV